MRGWVEETEAPEASQTHDTRTPWMGGWVDAPAVARVGQFAPMMNG